MKEYFTRNGARFELVDVRHDLAGLAEMQRLGALLPPLTVIDDIAVIGYRPDVFERLLFGDQALPT